MLNQLRAKYSAEGNQTQNTPQPDADYTRQAIAFVFKSEMHIPVLSSRDQYLFWYLRMRTCYQVCKSKELRERER